MRAGTSPPVRLLASPAPPFCRLAQSLPAASTTSTSTQPTPLPPTHHPPTHHPPTHQPPTTHLAVLAVVPQAVLLGRGGGSIAWKLL